MIFLLLYIRFSGVCKNVISESQSINSLLSVIVHGILVISLFQSTYASHLLIETGQTEQTVCLWCCVYTFDLNSKQPDYNVGILEIFFLFSVLKHTDRLNYVMT